MVKYFSNEAGQNQRNLRTEGRVPREVVANAPGVRSRCKNGHLIPAPGAAVRWSQPPAGASVAPAGVSSCTFLAVQSPAGDSWDTFRANSTKNET